MTVYLGAALANFREKGSLFPTTRWAAQSIARLVDPNSHLVVEYGCGTGVITHYILKQLNPRAKLLGIESDYRFTPLLSSIEDPRFSLLMGAVPAVLPLLDEKFPVRADVVVSGIPFSQSKGGNYSSECRTPSPRWNLHRLPV